MLVKNPGVSIIFVPYNHGEDPEKIKALPIRFRKGLTFLPGNNDVPPEALDLVESNKAFRRYFEEDSPRLILGHGKAKAKQVETADLKEGEAIKTIKETFDRDLLHRWAGSEKRGVVINAIRKQMKAIEPEKKKGEGGETPQKDEGSAETPA